MWHITALTTNNRDYPHTTMIVSTPLDPLRFPQYPAPHQILTQCSGRGCQVDREDAAQLAKEATEKESNEEKEVGEDGGGRGVFVVGLGVGRELFFWGYW